jgi:hypothetical protein
MALTTPKGGSKQDFMKGKPLDPTDVRLFGVLVNRLRNGTLPGVVSAPEGAIQRLESIYLRAQREVSGGGQQTFTRDEADLLIDIGQKMFGLVVTDAVPVDSDVTSLGSGTQGVGYNLRERF